MPNVQPDGRSVYSVFVRTVTQARNILCKLREVEGPESSTLSLYGSAWAQCSTSSTVHVNCDWLSLSSEISARQRA